MQRPIPGVFQGSVPDQAVNETRLGADIERTFGILALLLAGGASCLTLGLLSQSWPAQSSWLALKIGCSVLLALSFVGLWLKRQAVQAPRLETIGIYQAVLRRMMAGGGAIRNGPAEGGYAGVSALVADLASSLRSTQTGHTKLASALADKEAHLRQGRQQAQRIGTEIMHAAEVLSRAASRVSSADSRLAGEAANTARSLAIADNAVARALDGMAAVAASVRATTAGAQQMTTAAVQMSEVAHSTHRCIADLDDRTAKIVVALDYIERMIHAAASLGKAGSIQAAGQGAAADFVRVASELQKVAGSCQPALAEAGETMRELIAQTTEANRRTMEILELVGANHDVGRAVSHAVEQQGDEIARILTGLYEARPGFATLRASVKAVTHACEMRTDAADSIRKTVCSLPGHAEKLANMLRDLPDLKPSTH